MSNLLQQTYQQALATLENNVATLNKTYADQMQCKKGCSGCCISGFKIRYMDALQLIEGYLTLPPTVAALVIKNLQEPNRLACPLLIDGACSVYAHRPALCRAYGVIIQLGDKVATCDLNFQTLSDQTPIQTLDLLPYYDLLDDLSQRAWQAHPMPGLTTNGDSTEAPRVTINQLLTTLLQLASPSSPSANNPSSSIMDSGSLSPTTDAA